jgi:hypothetical protein
VRVTETAVTVTAPSFNLTAAQVTNERCATEQATRRTRRPGFSIRRGDAAASVTEA